MKYWTDSRSLKHSWRIRLEEELEYFVQTMVVSTFQEVSLISAGEQELRGSSQSVTQLAAEWSGRKEEPDDCFSS